MRRVRSLLIAAAVLAAAIGCASDQQTTDTVVEAPSTTAATSAAPEPADPEDLAKLAEQAEAAAREADEPLEELITEPVLGADISWPQCPQGLGIPERPTQGMPMPVPEARYVILGLTNGPGFTPNPCLADQVTWAATEQLPTAAYAVASYPDRDTLAELGGEGPFQSRTKLGRLRNVGYQQAAYNVKSMQTAGLRTPMLWIDVEPVPDFEWSADVVANAAVVQGLARGYTDAGLKIGVYSTPHLWQRTVGDLALGVPEWRAAGHTSRDEALSRCGADWQIQGGDAVFGQWVADDRDHNVTCPAVTSLTPWFHQY
ncbi:hypothetical protein NODU109028_04245 [Nocardioides dubius]|uniref:DUF1906 domain-containing protein n=1 Tax=Nocardioides dubius TaxID=317019 RepID=A0ABP4E8H4_9ACTN